MKFKVPADLLIFLAGLGIGLDILLCLNILFAPEAIEFIDHWQQIIGAFIGAAAPLAIFLLTEVYIKRKDALRRIEISNTYSLQNIQVARAALVDKIQRLRKFASDVRDMNNPLQTINFPPIGGIYIDPEGHNASIKSYYLHNKVLLFNSHTTGLNSTLTEFKNDFGLLMQMHDTEMKFNEKLIRENPQELKNICENFAQQIEGFANAIESFIPELNKPEEVCLQIRIYNRKLRSRIGIFHRISYEGIQRIKDLELVDEIDRKLKLEVIHEKQKVENRKARIIANQTKP